MNSLMDAARYALRCYRSSTGLIRTLPDFIIIGTQRGGTTSLYRYLTEQPNILPAVTKEIHFFDNNFQRGISWYRGHFPYSIQNYYAKYIRKQDFITGESSPYYLFHPLAPKRIAQILPQVKFIVLLRNPVERAFSQYYLEVDKGREKLSFEEAIACEEERTRGTGEQLASGKIFNSFKHVSFSYLARGIYADQLHHWFSFFPREQFVIFKSEEMYINPAAIFKQSLAFLNIAFEEPRVLSKEYKQHNIRTPRNVKMSPECRQRLVEYFEPHNERLYQLLGRDFGWN
jgi:Sulfotransferase domain